MSVGDYLTKRGALRETRRKEFDRKNEIPECDSGVISSERSDMFGSVLFMLLKLL